MYHSAMEPRPVSCASFVPLLRRMSYLILKRGFDLVFSLVLLVTCALLMAVIALVVWLDSPGKIIYTQIRLGYGGKPFTIYKFRSMQQSTAPDDAKWTSENDTRITRVGHILRLTHLDELPQLFNVLKGDMSIVGNRPLPLYEAELLTSDAYIERFMAPAGLTGLWQVEKRGGAGKMSAEERKQLDIKYAKEFSFWLDMKILCKTLTAFVQKENV